MKKNLIGAIVIFFVTLAFLMVIDDVTKSNSAESDQNVEIYNATQQQPEMVILDEDE